MQLSSHSSLGGPSTALSNKTNSIYMGHYGILYDYIIHVALIATVCVPLIDFKLFGLPDLIFHRYVVIYGTLQNDWFPVGPHISIYIWTPWTQQFNIIEVYGPLKLVHVSILYWSPWTWQFNPTKLYWPLGVTLQKCTYVPTGEQTQHWSQYFSHNYFRKWPSLAKRPQIRARKKKRRKSDKERYSICNYQELQPNKATLGQVKLAHAAEAVERTGSKANQIQQHYWIYKNRNKDQARAQSSSTLPSADVQVCCISSVY